MVCLTYKLHNMSIKKIIIVAILLATAVPCVTAQRKNSKAVLDNIHQRKSVRRYAEKKIPESVVTDLLKAAMAAPTGMNIQPWHFVVLTDTSKYDEIFAGNGNMRMFKESAVVIVICADTTVTRPPRNNPHGAAVTAPNPIWRDDMGACTENLLLAVEAYGLGACWTACYPFHDRMNTVKKTLNLPSNVVPYSVVPIGYPRIDEKPKEKWKPEKVHYGSW